MLLRNILFQLQVGIFHTRNGLHCIKKLAVEASDDIEVIPRGMHLHLFKVVAHCVKLFFCRYLFVSLNNGISIL